MLGQIILYISSPIKMLFGSVKKGIFPESLTKVNEHNIPVKAVLLQDILVSAILLGSSLLSSVDAVYNVLVTMTALTSLFPYILLFASYTKLRKERPNENRPYSMTKDNNKAIMISNAVLVICAIGIVLSAAPVMPSFKENVIYEIEMIVGSFVIIGIGLALWNRYLAKTGNKAGN